MTLILIVGASLRGRPVLPRSETGRPQIAAHKD